MADCGKQNSRTHLKNFYPAGVHALYNTRDLEYDRFYSSDYIIGKADLKIGRLSRCVRPNHMSH